MLKRFLWILLFAFPIIIVASRLWYHHLHPHIEQSNRLATDLTPDQLQDAVNTLVRERQMWSRFDNMSGHISVMYENTVDKEHNKPIVLDGDISIEQSDSSILLGYAMTITNKQGLWSVFVNKTGTNIEVDDPNKKVGVILNSINPRIVYEELVLPKVLLVPLFKDSLYPQGKETLDHLIVQWKPWLNQKTKNVPHSYTFRPEHSSNSNELSFANGHISEFCKAGEVEYPDVDVSFAMPVAIDGFWYPTEIQLKAKGEIYHISLSDLIIGEKNIAK